MVLDHGGFEKGLFTKLFACKYSIIRAFRCDSESRYNGIEAVYDIQYLFVDST